VSHDCALFDVGTDDAEEIDRRRCAD
jgi:hypothetical protein